MAKVHYTKKGQPYIILSSGKARFIKKGRRARRSAHGVARVTRRKTRRSTRRVSVMPRRSWRKHYARARGMLGGLRGPTLKGAADGYIAGTSTGGSIPGYLAAYIKGGFPGVAACFLAPTINSFGGSTRISSATVLHG